MKSSLLSTMMALAMTLSPGVFSSCATPTQTQALAFAEAGNAYATYVLQHNGAQSVKGLQDLANALPLIPVGKVSPNQLGVINAELQQVQKALPAGSSSTASTLYNQVGSIISLLSQSQAANGNPTAEIGILEAQCQDVQNGINNAIQFWEGQQSVTAPPSK